MWPWSKNRLINLFDNNVNIINKINKVIKIKIIIVKSWKKIIISYVGELEFCKFKFQVLIFNKSLFNLYIWILSSMHLSAILKINLYLLKIKKLMEFHYIYD